MLRSIVTLLLLALSQLCWSQTSGIYTDANEDFKNGMKWYNEQLFGIAKEAFEKAANHNMDLYDEKSKQLAKLATLYKAKAEVQGKFPQGEKNLMVFIEANQNSPYAMEGIRTMAKLRFDQKKYADAISFLERVDPNAFSQEEAWEISFIHGYSAFILKDFETAKEKLEELKGFDTQWYFQTYYYLAMIEFYNSNYEEAIEHFFIVENFPEYRTRIPYYIAQIYFAEERYAEVLSYVPSQLNSPNIENRKELRHILGQSHFILGNYEAAIPHLEFYEQNSRKMRKEDFYQLAFTQYQLGSYAKAVKNFKELTSLDSEMGQISNNYLGDANMKLGNNEEARVSFKNVTNYPYNDRLKEEATFNYGKLSAQLGYDRSAIQALMSLSPSAKEYAQAQVVLGELFESSKDYAMVIQTIEKMQIKAPEILKAYQKVILEQAIQLINDGDKDLALKTLQKAAQTPADNYYSAIIYFQIADLLHQRSDFQQSIAYLNQYFTLSKLVNSLPENARPVNAHYIQGYNHFKQKDYTNALINLIEAKNRMEADQFLSSPDTRQRRMYADVLNRIGDSYFTVNKYGLAADHYQKASTLRFPGQDYAFFQWAMIKGLQNQPYDKIVVLENLLEAVPGSSFLDDTYFQIGETYLALNQPREAELAYDKIRTLAQQSELVTRALLKLGLIAYNKGETVKAIEHYSAIFDYNPSRNEAQEALLALEEIYIRDLGRADDFAELVEKSTGYRMSNLERDSLSYIAAEGKFENGEYIEAIDSYTRYLENFPKGINRLKALFNRASSKTILKQYKQALPDYNLVIEAGPSEFYEEAVERAALIAYNEVQQFEEAFNYYSLLEEVTMDDLKRHDAQIGALRSAYRFGSSAASTAFAQKVITNPLSTDDEKALAYYIDGKIMYEKGELLLAKQRLQKVPEWSDNENTAEALYLINEITYRMGQLEEAEEATLETVSNSTAYPFWVAKNLILISRIYVDLNDLFNAKAAAEAVIENFPESQELQKEAQEMLTLVLEREAIENRIEEESETINLDTIKGNE